MMDEYNMQWRILNVFLFLWIESLYHLKANAQCMLLTAHSNAIGGRRMPTKTNMADCAEHCLSDLRCHSVDFNKQDNSCWIHDQWRPIKRAYCPCHHLEKVLQCKHTVPECFSIANNKTLYYGTKRTTASLVPCQRWDKQSPHKHGVDNPANFPDVSLSAAENFCRDPDGEGYPWCYTTNPQIRWSSCGVSSCAGPFTMKLGLSSMTQKTTNEYIFTEHTTATTQTGVKVNDEDKTNKSSSVLNSHCHLCTLSSCNNTRIIYPETSTVVIGCISTTSLILSMVLLIIRFRCHKIKKEYSPSLKTGSDENPENLKMSSFNVYQRF